MTRMGGLLAAHGAKSLMTLLFDRGMGGWGMGKLWIAYTLIHKRPTYPPQIKVLSVESGPGLSCSAADEVLKVIDDAL